MSTTTSKKTKRPTTMQAKHVSSKAHQQGKTDLCWANAVATAVRAYQREQGILEEHITKHSGIVHLLQQEDYCGGFGKGGAKDDHEHIVKVIETACMVANKKTEQNLNVNVRRVTAKDAKKLENTVMVSAYYLQESRWRDHQNYFKAYPKSILKKGELGRGSGDKCGHMIVIVGIGYDSKDNNRPYWKIKNSWGEGFADKGFFRVDFDAMKMEFFYVLEPLPPVPLKVKKSRSGAPKPLKIASADKPPKVSSRDREGGPTKKEKRVVKPIKVASNNKPPKVSSRDREGDSTKKAKRIITPIKVASTDTAEVSSKTKKSKRKGH